MESVEITSSEWKTKGKGKWLAVQIVGEKFLRNVMDKAAQAQFTGPGRYELTWKQDGEYLNIVGFKPVKPTEVLGTNGKSETKTFIRELDPNVVLQNKSICAQVAVKAAAEIVASMFQASKDVHVSYTSELARSLMAEMSAFVNGKEKAESKSDANEIKREPLPVA